MKRFFVALLVSVVVMPAVQWDIEQITTDPQHCASNPVMLMDSQGYCHVLYTQWDKDSGYATLEIASNKSGFWGFSTVDSANLEYFLGPYYNFGRNAEGNYFVAFNQFSPEDYFDLYIATDTSGEFVTRRLDNNGNQKINPVVQMDSGNNIHLSYWEYNEVLDQVQIRYGWFDDEGFSSQLATVNVHQDDPVGSDFLIVEDSLLYIFYPDDGEFRLNYTSRTLSDTSWRDVRINNSECFFPSAAADGSGVLHIAYRDDWEGIRYITNPTGGWRDEFAAAASELWWWQDGVCIAVDNENNPYIIYALSDYENGNYDLYFARRTETGWIEEPLASSPAGEYGGCGHYFHIDSENYGHVVYEVFSADGEDSELFYAKSREPVDVGVIEKPCEPRSISLEIRNSLLCLNLGKTSIVRLNLYDTAGRKVRSLVAGTYPAGAHEVRIDASGLTAGVYFVQGEIDGQSASAKLLKVR